MSMWTTYIHVHFDMNMYTLLWMLSDEYLSTRICQVSTPSQWLGPKLFPSNMQLESRNSSTMEVLQSPEFHINNVCYLHPFYKRLYGGMFPTSNQFLQPWLIGNTLLGCPRAELRQGWQAKKSCL